MPGEIKIRLSGQGEHTPRSSKPGPAIHCKESVHERSNQFNRGVGRRRIRLRCARRVDGAVGVADGPGRGRGISSGFIHDRRRSAGRARSDPAGDRAELSGDRRAESRRGGGHHHCGGNEGRLRSTVWRESIWPEPFRRRQRQPAVPILQAPSEPAGRSAHARARVRIHHQCRTASCSPTPMSSTARRK